MDLWYERIESPGTKWSVRVTRPLFSSEGKAGRVDVIETEDFGRALAVDGCLAITEGDGFAQREMLAHAPLNVHPMVRAALVIGARDCGTAAELLRYPQIERLVIVEDDPVILEAQRRFFPSWPRRSPTRGHGSYRRKRRPSSGNPRTASTSPSSNRLPAPERPPSARASTATASGCFRATVYSFPPQGAPITLPDGASS